MEKRDKMLKKIEKSKQSLTFLEKSIRILYYDICVEKRHDYRPTMGKLARP